MNNEKRDSIGMEIVGDLQNCNITTLQNLHYTDIKKEVTQIIQTHELSELGSHYHVFDDNGITGIVALAESHIAFHTWPHRGYVSLNVFVCNYQRNNVVTAKVVFNELASIFEPTTILRTEVHRFAE